MWSCYKDCFLINIESTQDLIDEEFGSDEEENYAMFTKVNQNIRPTTSTQIPSSQKEFPYVKDLTNHPPNHPKPYEKNEKNIDKLIIENNLMLKALMREVKCLRREIKHSKSATPSTSTPNHGFDDLPTDSKEAFVALEEQIKQDSEMASNLVNYAGINKIINTYL